MARASRQITRRNGPLKWFEACLWLSGFCLLAVSGAQILQQTVAAEREVQAFLQSEATTPDRSPQLLPLPQQVDTSLWSDARIEYFRSAEGSDKSPIGVLYIEHLNLQAPIYTGTSDDTLNRGIGWLDKTASLDEVGNTALAAHRDSFFRVLKDIEPGDPIVLTSRNSKRQYRVQNTQIVTPEQVEVLAPTGHKQITLITCYPFYYVGSAPQRFIVTATEDSLAQLH